MGECFTHRLISLPHRFIDGVGIRVRPTHSCLCAIVCENECHHTSDPRLPTPIACDYVAHSMRTCVRVIAGSRPRASPNSRRRSESHAPTSAAPSAASSAPPFVRRCVKRRYATPNDCFARRRFQPPKSQPRRRSERLRHSFASSFDCAERLPTHTGMRSQNDSGRTSSAAPIFSEHEFRAAAAMRRGG